MSGQWRPAYAEQTSQLPDVGTLVARDYRPWRVVEVHQHPEDRWDYQDHAMVDTYGPTAAPVVVTLRPPRAEHRDQDLVLRCWPGRTPWWIYPDQHYPVCGTCGDAQPCREQDAARAAAAAMAHAKRYEITGVCPECGKPVAPGQRPITFARNAIWPLGGPVVFHGDQLGCRTAAERYTRHLTSTTGTALR